MQQQGVRFRVRAKVWIDGEGETVLGLGRGELLQAVRDRGSISGAARQMGMSYATAWHRLHSISAAAGQEVVQTRAGGRRGGGAVLTPVGEALLEAWEHLQRSVARFEERTGAELAELLADLSGD